jgi:hypothetical protein
MPIWTYMRVVLQKGTMPLPPVKIDPADRDTLLRWLDAGAPTTGGPGLCASAVDSGDGNDVAGGEASSANDGLTVPNEAGTAPSSSDAGAAGVPNDEGVDAGEEMALAATPDADAAAAGDSIEPCCSNDGGAQSE